MFEEYLPAGLINPDLTVSEIAAKIAEDFPLGLQTVGEALITPIIGMMRLIMGVATGDRDCNAVTATPYVFTKIVLGFVTKWFGDGLDKPMYRTSRTLDFLCPDMIPGQPEINSLRARGIIDDQLWSCWTRANNNLEKPQKTILDGMENIPTPLEIVMLKNRDAVTGNFYDQMMQLNAVRKASTRGMYETLAMFVPGPSDLVRFMVRDVFDKSVVDKYQYDQGFREKFSGKARDWAKAQGMDEDQFLYFWRAHWQLPSAGQGFTMYHRLRPDRVADEVVTTREDIRKLLEVGDMPKYWVDRMIEISRPLLRLIDLRKAFYFGVISAAELGQQQQDRGLSARDAGIIVGTQLIARVDFWKGRRWYKGWVAGTMTFAQVVEESEKEGVTLLDLAELRDYVLIERKQATLKVCIAALRKRYEIGDIVQGGAIGLLLTTGVDLDFATELVGRWNCEIQAKGKVIAAGELCSWVEQGLISIPEYRQRLIFLGYTSADADRVAAVCSAKINARIAAMQEKLRKERLAAQKKAEADRAKAILAGQRVEEKRHKGRIALELVEEKAHIKWMKAAAQIADTAKADIDEVRRYVADRVNELADQRGWSLTGAADMVAEVASEIVKYKVIDYQAAFANAWAALPRRDIFDEARGPKMTTPSHPDLPDLAKPIGK